ncbi:MAG: hypothetical protein Q9174_000600 [Haloplaca sp. 1 TL-2023]
MGNEHQWLGAKEDGFIVGVTAFGLYAETHDFNASNLVLAALPATLESSSPDGPEIHILKYPEIHVTYDAVSRAVHDIWNNESATWAKAATTAGIKYDRDNSHKIDFVVHLGQMRAFPGYSFETLANRDDYKRKDLDQLVPATVEMPQGILVEERFAECPDVLRPDVNVEAITDAIKDSIPDILLRASAEAGRFSCEYLFYSSMAELHARGLQKKVMFVHVPSKNSEQDISTGVKVVTELIRRLSLECLE